jgi:anti-sigma factor RsiW
MLTCQQLTELATENTEGHLSLFRRLQFEMHLGMCRHCRAYLQQIKMTMRTLGKLSVEPIPDDIKQELLVRFRGMSPKRS